MGQFKPMVKMMTTEPSAILKLKKGGKVEKKADGGFMPMQSTMPAGLPARGGLAPAASPARPSLAARRRAMNPNLLMKKGGKASCEKVEEELKEHEAKPMGKAHKKAAGGIIKTITNKTTKMVDGDKKDTAKGTKGIKEGQPAGYKTGGVIDGKPAGYKKGGKVPGLSSKTVEGNEGKFTNNNVNDGDKFDSAHGTKGVRDGNAGGFKKGGSTKKAYAAGGNVVDDGKAVKMPPRIKHAPVANTMQSGTFKKGGKVAKYSEAGTVIPSDIIDQKKTDEANRGYENWKSMEKKENEAAGQMFKPVLNFSKEQGAKVKQMLNDKFGQGTPAGSVTKTKESVTVSPGKKRGGKVC